MGKTGLDVQVGFGEESTWGTRVAPTRFLEILNESVKLDLQRVQSQGLRSGRRFPRKRYNNKKGAAGTIALEVPTKGFGLITKYILGAIATTTPVGGTLTRDHTATPGSFDGESLSVQIGRPDVNGAKHPFDYIGAKIVQAEFSGAVDGLLQCTLTLDAKDEQTNQTLATPSYATGIEQFFFAGASLTIGGVATDIRDFSCAISSGLKTDRYFMRNSTLKKEQIEDTADRGATGTFNCDYENNDIYDDFVAGTEAEIVALWRAPVAIEGALFPEFEIKLGRVQFDGETPSVGGPDIVNQAVPFTTLESLDADPTVSLRVRSDDATP